jgi:hypothetical protein
MGSKFKESNFYPECVRCGARMGVCTRLEYEAFLDGKRLCFDCDKFEAGLYPEFWQEITSGSIVFIDKKPFFYEDGLWKQEKFTHARERSAHARTCLSSSTYLNSPIRNWAVLWKLAEYAPCPECHGVRGYYENQHGPTCRTCNDAGSIKVLAAWVDQIVNGEREHA